MAAILHLIEPKIADLKNPTLEPNTKLIGRPTDSRDIIILVEVWMSEITIQR